MSSPKNVMGNIADTAQAHFAFPERRRNHCGNLRISPIVPTMRPKLRAVTTRPLAGLKHSEPRLLHGAIGGTRRATSSSTSVAYASR